MSDACISKTAFWVLVGSIWVIGLLGIIITSISIDNIKTLNKNTPPDRDQKSTAFQVIMLIVFIIIICGASIYAFALARAPEGLPQGAHSFLLDSSAAAATKFSKGARDLYSRASSAVTPSKTSPTPEGVELQTRGVSGRPYRTHHTCPHRKL